MKLLLCSIGFRSEAPDVILRRAADVGYDGVEMWFNHVSECSPDELRHLRQIATETGISIPVLSPYFILTRGEKEMNETLETARACIEAATQLGCKKIRVFTDVAGDGIGSDVATEQQWAQAVEGLRTITAMDRSLTFVVETHEHTLADTVPAATRLLTEVGAPNLKINFQANTEFRAMGLLNAFDQLADQVDHMHLQQLKNGLPVDLPDSGDIDYTELLTHVRQSGYDPTIAVEYCHYGITWEQAAAACTQVRHWWDAR